MIRKDMGISMAGLSWILVWATCPWPASRSLLSNPHTGGAMHDGPERAAQATGATWSSGARGGVCAVVRQAGSLGTCILKEARMKVGLFHFVKGPGPAHEVHHLDFV